LDSIDLFGLNIVDVLILRQQQKKYKVLLILNYLFAKLTVTHTKCPKQHNAGHSGLDHEPYADPGDHRMAAGPRRRWSFCST